MRSFKVPGQSGGRASRSGLAPAAAEGPDLGWLLLLKGDLPADDLEQDHR
eukprot:CAMPEP_0180509118 /NCGR_PEP_ID=MMETSP1036_2-20121128/49542_1 /TAXON_ID=632150 /ORGANISM="Azadinium spinosum, Strain 3D9" /LENGTH=49 /DNA_ID= /DNA_START= /DNA_END= /DNA_ORIENTATION=